MVKRNPKLYSKNVVKAVAIVKEVAVITVAGASMVGQAGQRSQDIRGHGPQRDQRPDDLAERLGVEHQHGGREVDR